MGTWDWNDVDHTIGAIEGSAPTALLAASIIPNQKLDDDYEKSVAIKTGLEQLSLIEWSVSDMVPDLFALLRGKGSSHG